MARSLDLKEISNLRGVQRTLIFPLWGRAVFSRLYPEILEDKEAAGIIGELTRRAIPPQWVEAEQEQSSPARVVTKIQREPNRPPNEDAQGNSWDCDFGEIEKAFGEYGGLAYIVRGRKIDGIIKQFIAEHPRATIVNIGAGFDTTFSRVDNGAVHWYDIDLCEVIALREKIIPAGSRNICIAKSVFDYSWLKDVRFNEKDGILFVAGGVFYYFT